MTCHSRRLRFYAAGPVGRNNGRQLAEYVGHDVPAGLQLLLNRALWDADEIRDNLRTLGWITLHRRLARDYETLGQRASMPQFALRRAHSTARASMTAETSNTKGSASTWRMRHSRRSSSQERVPASGMKPPCAWRKRGSP
ncbi:hypothetical protein GCM10010121_088000 [Streptomyces brasiliensis]|uniref:Transposase IS701-like DDE domain-containing protein n=1 Tax=Streptomyces brasiliensis TaxID=1954 RepID=A0A917UKG8_9ACTN|nr:hypothetical protein GCM10010121_088000 [Streptomyces brasiliensis]